MFNEQATKCIFFFNQINSQHHLIDATCGHSPPCITFEQLCLSIFLHHDSFHDNKQPKQMHSYRNAFLYSAHYILYIVSHDLPTPQPIQMRLSLNWLKAPSTRLGVYGEIRHKKKRNNLELQRAKDTRTKSWRIRERERQRRSWEWKSAVTRDVFT